MIRGWYRKNLFRMNLRRPAVRAGLVLGAALLVLGAFPVLAYRLILIEEGAGTYSRGRRTPPGFGETVRWLERQVPMAVQPATIAGPNLVRQTILQEVEDAFQAWQDVPCADIAFDVKDSASATRSPTDGTNSLYWPSQGSQEYSDGTLGRFILALTILTVRGDQTLTDADIVFNAQDFQWGTTDGPGKVAIWPIATHEAGHLLGLHHTELGGGEGPVMTAIRVQGRPHVLHADDRAALCHLYPTRSGASSAAAGDFNGDGYDDLAVGVPGESLGAVQGAGAVNVIYGGPSGLEPFGHWDPAARRQHPDNQIWHQDSNGILGGAEADDRFGTALVAGDFNRDGISDLAIGAPGEALGSVPGAGAVHVLYGSPTGLADTGNQMLHQDTPELLGGAEAQDRFGSALASADFNRDGFQDLVIGVPGESIVRASGAGLVHVLFGGPAGVTVAGNQIWHQDTTDVANHAEPHDRFGAALATGDFDRNGHADLAVGVPGEDAGLEVDAGAVHLLYGSATGLTTDYDKLWDQNVEGVLGGAETGDSFGAALAAGDFDRDGFSDLAVGIPGESIGSLAAAGAVQILYGASPRLGAARNQLWHQDVTGIEGGSEPYDHLGATLTTGDFDGDGFHDLAIGVPNESIDRTLGAGAVNVLYGAASGLAATRNQIWHQDAGLFSAPETDDRLGSALVSGRFRGKTHWGLAIGVMNESIEGIPRTGAVHVIPGGPSGLHTQGDQIWHQNSAGIQGQSEPNDGFGSSQ